MDSNHDFRVQSAASCHWTKRECLNCQRSGCRGAIRTPVPGFKVQGPATRRPGITLTLRLHCLLLIPPSRRIELVAHDGIEPSFPVGKTGGLPLAECAKKRKPPIFVGGSEKLRAMDRPRYMNVPSPAPCHANVAGVGKQSVWGLRIIGCSSISTVTSFRKFVNTKVAVLRQSEAAENNLSAERLALFHACTQMGRHQRAKFLSCTEYLSTQRCDH